MMKDRLSLSLLISRLGRIRTDKGGVAALEFALILPLMLSMYLGSVELTKGIMASRKVNLVSRTIADISAQQSTAAKIPSTQIAAIFTASTAIMAPYSTSSLKMTASAITIQTTSSGSCCVAMVNWSYTQGGTLRPCGTPLTQTTDPNAQAAYNTIPQGLIPTSVTITTPNTAVQYLIIADVQYIYTPNFGKALLNWSNGMSYTNYMRPRASGQVLLQSPITAASGQSGQICT